MNQEQAGLIRHIFDDFKFREALAWALDAHAVREGLDADEFFEHDDALGALYTSIADHVLEDWPTRLRALEQELLDAARRIDAMKYEKVIIGVRGGFADVDECPDWLSVEIRDYDVGFKCSRCGRQTDYIKETDDGEFLCGQCEVDDEDG